METLFASRIRTGSCVATDPCRSWSPNSKQFRTTTFASEGSINRYYVPATDQFLSIDPDVQTTDQPYAFVNDDPLNRSDPLGLCWFACGVWHDITSAGDSLGSTFGDVGNFVEANGIALGGLVLDTGSFALTGIGVVTGDPLFTSAGAAVGFAGTVVSGIGCERDGGLACVGFAVGGVATTAGILGTGLELSEAAPGLASVLRGAGITLGGASVTTDIAALVVKVHDTVESAAKKVVLKIVKKK